MNPVRFERVPRPLIDTDNIRDRRDPEVIESLVNSIKAQGLLYPLLVQPKKERFRLLDGHGRLEALDVLGWKEIPVQIDEGDASDAAARIKSLIANMHREALSGLAEARTIDEIMKARGWNQAETSKQTGINTSRLSKALSYLKLSPALAEELSSKGVGLTVAYQLSRISDPEEQLEAAKQYLQGDVKRDSIRRRRSSPPKQPNAAVGSRFVATLADKRSIAVSGPGSNDIECLIETMQEGLTRLRQARAKGYSPGVLSKMLRDEVKANITGQQAEEDRDVG